MDLFMYVKDSQKLSSYKLDDVCDAFLKDSSKVVLDYPDWVKGLLETAKDGLVKMYPGESAQEIIQLMDQSIGDCPGPEITPSVTNLWIWRCTGSNNLWRVRMPPP